MAAQWYQNHLGTAVRVLLVTNDRENKRKAVEGGIPAETGIEFGYYLYIIHIEFYFSLQIKFNLRKQIG